MRDFTGWDGSRIYADTVRDVWIYVPVQLESPAAPSLMVFQDGWMYLDPAGPVRATCGAGAWLPERVGAGAVTEEHAG